MINLWNKFYYAVLYKEPNLIKAKINPVAPNASNLYSLKTSEIRSVYHYFLFYFFQFYCNQNSIISMNFKGLKFQNTILVIPCVLLGLPPQPLIELSQSNYKFPELKY